MADPITITAFEELIGEAYELDQEIDMLETQALGPLKKKLAEVEAKILATLEAQELTSFKSKHGTVVRSSRFSVRVPADTDAKVEFFKWLNTKGRDIYWKYVTVNSNSLNSLYKQEMEVAKEEGNIDFKIPGIGAPTYSPVLSRRAK